MKAIPTLYKGYQMRSRLEARWACFFDALRLKWEYEPEGFDLGTDGWYLPDFWVDGMQSYVEIKPARIDGIDNAITRCRSLAWQSGRPVILIAGQPWPGEYLIMFTARSAWGWMIARRFRVGKFCNHMFLTDIVDHSAVRKDLTAMKICPGRTGCADCVMGTSSDPKLESAYLAGRQMKGFGATA